MGILLVLGLIGIPILLIFFAIDIGYSKSGYDDALKIKFKSFLSFYYINPNTWKLEDNYVKYCIVHKQQYKSYIIDKWYETKQIFYFNYIDYKRYCRFKKRLDKNEKIKLDTKKMSEFISCVKQDIQNFETVNQEFTNEQLNQLIGGILK